MKNIVRNILILLSPILLVVIVNEFPKDNVSSEKYDYKCSWACHNNTLYCKSNHVKILTPYFNITDKLYFGLITKLQQTGSYALANIVILVVLIPVIIFFLIIKILNLQLEISKFRKND